MSIESTIEEPILYFETFFLNNGYNNFRRSFFEPWLSAYEIDPGSVYIDEVEEYIVHHFDHDDFNHSKPTKILLIDELKVHFRKEIQKSKLLIKKGIRALIFKDISPLNYLHEVNKTTQELLSKSTILINKYPFCKACLESIITFTNEIIGNIQPRSQLTELGEKKVENVLRNDTKTTALQKRKFHPPSFFHISKLKVEFFTSLFSLLNTNGIIDSTSSLEEDANKFYYLFRSPEPWKADYSIQFLVDNMEVALVVEELENHIDNLTGANIEKCGCFFKVIRNNHSPFKSGDLYTALSSAKKKIKEDSNWIRPEIQLVITEIRKLAKKYGNSLTKIPKASPQPLS